MSLTARLQFGDNGFGRYSKEYLVADFKCHVSRGHNEVRPDASPHCDRMEMTVVVPGREDLNLYEWYVSHSLMSGRILIELSTSDQNPSGGWKEVQFENGLCYSISEDYHIDKAYRRTLKLQIAVEQLKVDSVLF